MSKVGKQRSGSVTTEPKLVVGSPIAVGEVPVYRSIYYIIFSGMCLFEAMASPVQVLFFRIVYHSFL